MYDIIGDIHGHAFELVQLLNKLGYVYKNGYYQNTDGRKAIFLGDFIDRGPLIKETVDIAKAMVDNGSAFAVMGNHEYNAICFNTLNKNGDGYLRPHNLKNIHQHEATLRQYAPYQKEYDAALEWFKTLPLFLEFSDFRVVHAMWHQPHIDFLKTRLSDARIDEDFLQEANIKNSTAYTAVEETLKGKEQPLPANVTFKDKDGNERNVMRMKWWEGAKNAATYRELSFMEDQHSIPEQPIDDNFEDFSFYSENEKTVFIGHYWLRGNPKHLSKNVICVDYSVAKGGSLVGYRQDAEERFLWV